MEVTEVAAAETGASSGTVADDWAACRRWSGGAASAEPKRAREITAEVQRMAAGRCERR